MNKFLIIIFFICFISEIEAKATIQIKYKVGDEIITNTDIQNEKKYLIFLRPELNNLSEEEIIKVSENSLIKELIKKKEINKVFKDLNNEILIKEIKNKLFRYKKVKNEKELKSIILNANIKYEKIIDKMKYELFWNELVFQKYNNLIKIDKERLKVDLNSKISKNKKYEYNISELLFELNENETLENKYKEIISYIKLNDFRTAATRFSISNSSNNGGDIGWIKETLFSRDLNDIIKNMKKSQITKPIKYPNGYLILRINDKREIKRSINFEEELEQLVSFEKNKQLNQFSLLFYKKLKQNTVINEY